MILQFEITKTGEVISLPRDIHSQEFIFRRAIIVYDTGVSGSSSVANGGGLFIQLGFMKGNEIMSNTLDGVLIVAQPGTGHIKPDPGDIYDQRYDLNFNAEDIKSSFTTNVRNFNGETQDFTADGGPAMKNPIKRIILFFEFTSLYPSIGY